MLNRTIMGLIKIKRAYEPAEKKDGFRVLVDRLWPRGIKKTGANINVWMKEIAPSATLRKWFSHDPEKWPDFKKKYEKELAQSPVVEELVSEIKKHRTVTLVYAAKDQQHNQAVVLQQFLQRMVG